MSRMIKWASYPLKLWNTTGMVRESWYSNLQCSCAAPRYIPVRWQWSRTFFIGGYRAFPQMWHIVASMKVFCCSGVKLFMGVGDVTILSHSFAIPSNSNANHFFFLVPHHQDMICRKTVRHRNYTLGSIQCRKPHAFGKLLCLIFSLEHPQLILADSQSAYIINGTFSLYLKFLNSIMFLPGFGSTVLQSFTFLQSSLW